jgi:hypothetical protein
MKREVRIHAQGANLTVVMSRDAEGFSAIITGDIVDPPRVGDSDVPDRIIRNEHYGPVTVRAPSLEELKRGVEEKIDNDGFSFIRWLDE